MDKKLTATRKIHSGKVYDKDRTKQKLLNAVGKVIKKEGYTGLKVSKIATVAGVNKKLIYVYFGTVDALIETYLRQHDYWTIAELDRNKKAVTTFDLETAFELLKDQYNYFESSPEMQNIVLWELSEYHKTLREAVDRREEFGKKIFKISDKQFKGTGVNFRALNAILVAAIYYLVLHAKSSGSTVCEIDTSTPKGKKAIIDTVGQILGWAYEKADAKSLSMK